MNAALLERKKESCRGYSPYKCEGVLLHRTSGIGCALRREDPAASSSVYLKMDENVNDRSTWMDDFVCARTNNCTNHSTEDAEE